MNDPPQAKAQRETVVKPVDEMSRSGKRSPQDKMGQETEASSLAINDT